MSYLEAEAEADAFWVFLFIEAEAAEAEALADEAEAEADADGAVIWLAAKEDAANKLAIKAAVRLFIFRSLKWWLLINP